MELIAGIVLLVYVLRVTYTSGRDRGRLQGYSFGVETTLSHFLVSDKLENLTLTEEDMDRLREDRDA